VKDWTPLGRGASIVEPFAPATTGPPVWRAKEVNDLFDCETQVHASPSSKRVNRSSCRGWNIGGTKAPHPVFHELGALTSRMEHQVEDFRLGGIHVPNEGETSVDFPNLAGESTDEILAARRARQSRRVDVNVHDCGSSAADA
jgi:hypothetical protein